jgi:hypothetical protein
MTLSVTFAGAQTLKYTSWMAAGEDKPVLSAFMAANPGIKVEDEILEGSRYQSLLKTRVLGGDIPDVMLIMPDQIQEFAKLGLLADVSSEPSIALQKKAPSIDASLSLAGKTYGFSVNGGVAEHPIGIAEAVPALMVPAGRGGSKGEHRDPAQDGSSVDGVTTNGRGLGHGQRPGLAENLCGNEDLAHVVEQRRNAELTQFRGIHPDR